MKRHFKQLLVAFLALTMVLTGAMCVQAKTITKPAQTLTLYPSKSLHYNANRRIFWQRNLVDSWAIGKCSVIYVSDTLGERNSIKISSGKRHRTDPDHIIRNVDCF